MNDLEIFIAAKALIPGAKRGFCCRLLRAQPRIEWEAQSRLQNLMGLWPDGTGSNVYPVPADKEKSLNKAGQAYMHWPDYKFFDINTDYGRNRLAMVEWMGEYLLEQYRI